MDCRPRAADLTIGDGRGAIVNNGGVLVLTNSTLSDNSGGDFGGGIANLYGTVTLTNCTLSSNSGGDHGCGISNWGNATLTNCTLNGTSIFNSRGCFGCTGGGTLTLANTIVANSPANSPSEGDCTAWITDGAHNLIENATNPSGLTNGVNGNLVGVDPLLDPDGLKDNGGPTETIALLPGSPAVNAGDPAVCANPPVDGVDQRGYARPGTGHTQCSIGAYEADAFLPESCVGDCDGTGSVTIDEIITLVNIALGNAVMSDCDVGDANDDGQITIDEILTAVNSALNGCPVPDVSGTRQRDQAAIVSSTCAAAVTARVQSSIDAGEWNCTYAIGQSGPNLTITETCPDGMDTFPGTVDSTGRITVVRTEQETQDSCTFTETSRFETNGSASTSTGVGRLQFDFSGTRAFTDCEIVVESRFSRP